MKVYKLNLLINFVTCLSGYEALWSLRRVLLRFTWVSQILLTLILLNGGCPWEGSWAFSYGFHLNLRFRG